MTQRRRVVSIAAASIALAVLAVACDDARPTEADLSPEADLAYPGGGLNFGYAVTARVETAGEYDVVVVVDRDG